MSETPVNPATFSANCNNPSWYWVRAESTFDGKLIDRFAEPEYKRWLLTFRQAREEGLITTDVFVDKRAQMEEKIAQGRYFSMLYQRTDFATQQGILYERDPQSIYMAIDGPANSNMDAVSSTSLRMREVRLPIRTAAR